MQQMIDEREMWTGVGYILGGTRFSVNVSVASDRPAGYRVRAAVRWQKPVPAHAQRIIWRALDIAGLEVKDNYETQEDLTKWLAWILHFGEKHNLRNKFADQWGLHMFLWIHDNPPPRAYEDFIKWAEDYDAETDALSLSLLKEVSKEGHHED